MTFKHLVSMDHTIHCEKCRDFRYNKQRYGKKGAYRRIFISQKKIILKPLAILYTLKGLRIHDLSSIIGVSTKTISEWTKGARSYNRIDRRKGKQPDRLIKRLSKMILRNSLVKILFTFNKLLTAGLGTNKIILSKLLDDD